jgi:hypothetical protein
MVYSDHGARIQGNKMTKVQEYYEAIHEYLTGNSDQTVDQIATATDIVPGNVKSVLYAHQSTIFVKSGGGGRYDPHRWSIRESPEEAAT